MSVRRMLERRKESAERQRSVDRVAFRSSARCGLTSLGFLSGLCLIALAGCSSLSRDGESGMLDLSRLTDIGGIRGPLERSLYGEESPLEKGRRFTDAERQEVRLCRETFDNGDYEKSIKLCKKAAKKLKESSLGEEAQFYLAESYYGLGKYSYAQDGYDQLFEDYPSTRYVEPATRRLFAIAREWLEVAEASLVLEWLEVREAYPSLGV